MHPLIKESVALLGKLRANYLQALDLGANLHKLGPEELAPALQHRARIWRASKKIIQQMKDLQTSMAKEPIPPSQLAFLREQRARVKDLAPKFQEQGRRVGGLLRKRCLELRSEMAGLRTQSKAIQQYLKAPTAKPLVQVH
ncbi:MAG TPA: hypothetical protein VLM37_07950 [Fibrobacteraceae bacterium]|nr:hypothetical protein [Fibrobacteraceae bacterium]